MASIVEKRINQAERICKQAGVQLTPIRKALLVLIYSHDVPITAYELLRLYRETSPKAESMTVYRALDFLKKNHLIHRLESKNAYAACHTPEKQHQAQFLLCEKCSQSQEIYVSALEKAAKNTANQYHFVLSERPIEIIGICKKCLHP
jgi:Fur family zinc uptake transcriptional regulator